MDAEVVAWALLVLGVLVMVVLAALLGRHVRRLGRVRAAVLQLVDEPLAHRPERMRADLELRDLRAKQRALAAEIRGLEGVAAPIARGQAA